MIKHFILVIILTLGFMSLLIVDEQCFKMTGQGGIIGFTQEKGFFGMDVSDAARKLF